MRPNNNKYIIGISFMNYLREKSGVPKVMLAHQEMFLRHGISYVGIFSVKKMLFHNKLMLFCMYGLIIDGEFMGVFQMNQIITLLLEWNEVGIKMVNIHIHHLMYTNFKTICTLVDTFSNVPIKIYLHDYYLVCLNYNFLVNGRYCGGKGLNDDVCKTCKSYHDRKKHKKKVQFLLEKWRNRSVYISPSEIVKENFGRFYPEYYDKVLIIPHQMYEKHYKGNLELLDKNSIIRVAFLGVEQYHKGWAMWKKIVTNAPKEKYKFIVFNSNDNTYEHMEKVKVFFSKDNLNAMTNTLREHKVHIAVLWSVVPETYSYTCNEAFSANMFIVTNTISGNIQTIVEKNRDGVILEKEQDIIDLFKNTEKLREMINSFRANTSGGPFILHENEKIVKIVCQEQDFGEIKVLPCQKGISKIVNKPFLWLLNKIYNILIA